MITNSVESSAIFPLRDALSKHLVGHETLIERMTIALLTGGHCLIEGPPGIAKTKTVNTFSQLLTLSFSRIQATPDLLPADLTGTDVYRQETGKFEFLSGPLFNQVILVDEINRAPPKVQSALLEAMGERQITTGNTTRALSKPFMVTATQNPIEHEGTYPLPEAQLDRFMFHIELSLPSGSEEREILDHVLNGNINNSTPLNPVMTVTEIQQSIEEVRNIHISSAVRDYITRLVSATRGEGQGGEQAKDIEHAASPRGSIFLANAAQAKAWMLGRDHVQPADVADLTPDVLSGRISLTYRARADGKSTRAVIKAILDNTPVV